MLGKREVTVKQKTNVSKPFHCPHCKVKSSTVGDLRMHLKSSHSKIDNRKPHRIILNEDMSLLDDSNDGPVAITLDELPQVIPDKPTIDCDWLPCDYASSNKSLLIKHIG